MSARSKMLAIIGICSILTCMSFGAMSSRTASSYTKGLALTFQQNRGQAPAPVQFLTQQNGLDVFLNRSEAVFNFHPNPSADGAVLRTTLLGSNSSAPVTAEELQQGKINYLDRQHPDRDITEIPTFRKVRYGDVYRGIDLVYYGRGRQLEYDFEVAPGGDPGSIAMHIAGADSIKTDSKGNLLIQVGNRQIVWLKPVAYQTSGVKTKEIVSNYKLIGSNKVAFALGDFDHSKKLVIDPTLVYSTYLGGTAGAPDDQKTSYDTLYAAAVDTSGNAYVLGVTHTFDYPTTPGAYSAYSGSAGDTCNVASSGVCPVSIVVSKISSNGSTLLYSTYYKEDDRGDLLPADIATDSSNRAYFAYTDSRFTGTTPATCGCVIGELAVLNASGSAIDYSISLGAGSPQLTGVAFNDLAVEGRMAYVTGWTSVDLPVTGNAYQSTRKSSTDSFVAKFDTTKAGDASIIYLSYFGGSSDRDIGTGIAVANGNAYITGFTGSADLPTTAGVFQPNYAGSHEPVGDDSFLAKFNTNASGSASLVYSTYLGGSQDNDETRSIAVDSNGNAYVTGLTYSTDFPTTPGAYSRSFNAGGADMFVSKLNSTASTLLMSTFFPGASPQRIRVDSAHNIYVVGSTEGGLPTTADALRKTRPGGSTPCGPEFQSCTSDGFFSVLGHTSGTLIYSTYLGGTTGYEQARGLALTPTPSAVVAGLTASDNFPVTGNAFQKTLHGQQDGFVMKFSFASSGSTTCSAPSTARTIHICSPTNGSTVSSPVKISATAKPGSSAIKVMQVYVDGVKKYEKTSTNTISTSLSMSTGTHRVTVQAQDSAGYFRSTVNITVH